MVGAPKVLTREEYLADANFLNIDAKLRSDNSLTGYDVVEVSRQLVNGNNYRIKYRNQSGAFVIYEVYSFDGKIKVKFELKQFLILQQSNQHNQSICQEHLKF